MFCESAVLLCPLLLQEIQDARVKEFDAERFRERPNWGERKSRKLSAVRGHRKSSQKPSETNKVSVT